MINYIEKGFALHQRIAARGHSIERIDGKWFVDDPAAVQQIINDYSLADACSPVIVAIKALAREKILAFLPDWKQSNCNARMNELNMIRFARAWTDEETAEVVGMQALWGRAEAIRAASNAHEAVLGALQEFSDIIAYDFSTGWPE